MTQYKIYQKPISFDRVRIALVSKIILGLGLILGAYTLVLYQSPNLLLKPIAFNAGGVPSAHPVNNQNSNRLIVPKIGVDVAIVVGANEEVLKQGAWHRKPENGSPITGGNFVLSAHRFLLGLTPDRKSVV